MSTDRSCSIGWSAARLARQVELALSELDLSSAQYRMLVQLAQGAEASSALAQKLAVSPPSVSTVVCGLVQRGAVERVHSPKDRRRVSLVMTERGRDLLSVADQAVWSRLSSIADELGDQSREASAIDGLALWGEALDRARQRRLSGALESSPPVR